VFELDGFEIPTLSRTSANITSRISRCLGLFREIDPEPTIAGVVRALPRGASFEYVRHLVDGLRKAGVPEQ
jgi:hypothetical protein